MNSNESVVIIDLDANFLLALPFVLLDQLGPVRATITHPLAPAISTKGSVATLCSHLTFCHLETVVYDKDHLDVLITRVSLRVVLNLDGSISFVVDSRRADILFLTI